MERSWRIPGMQSPCQVARARSRAVLLPTRARARSHVADNLSHALTSGREHRALGCYPSDRLLVVRLTICHTY